jgi:DNA-binding HxlR family transcriptional regulator
MAYADTPPRVVYELTELGLSLHDIICAMKDWGDALRDEILKPRTSALVDQQREHPAGGVEE